MVPKKLDEELEAAVSEAPVDGENQDNQQRVPEAEIPPSQPRSPEVTEETPQPEEAAGQDIPKDPPLPPPSITERKIKERLRRIFTPHADGSYKVPLEMVEEYKCLERRGKIMALFEKVGFDSDRGCQKMVVETLPDFKLPVFHNASFSVGKYSRRRFFFLGPFFLTPKKAALKSSKLV